MKKTISRLPDSELDIMLVLWNHEPPMGRLEIERVVNEKKKLAPTTILSLLTRLEKKGFVSAKKEGKMNLYTPLVTQEEYQQQESRSVLEKLYGNSLKRFVNALYQGEKMTACSFPSRSHLRFPAFPFPTLSEMPFSRKKAAMSVSGISRKS